MFIAFALGELASAAPTSGGLYYWTYKYSSPRWRTLTSWLVGCTCSSSHARRCKQLSICVLLM